MNRTTFAGFCLLLCVSVRSSSVPTSLTYDDGALVCNVTTYDDEIGAAITKAHSDCVLGNKRRTSISQQAVLYIPPGNYQLNSKVALQGGQNFFLHLDGAQIFYTTHLSDLGGSETQYFPFLIKNADRVVISGDHGNTQTASLRGTLNGQAHLYPDYGSNIHTFRVQSSSNVVIGRLNVFQSPYFHLVLMAITNMEVFEVLVIGPLHGKTDAIDISGSNIWVHDCQIHNGDECVTLKSPANNVLVERIYCNHSEGTQMGSFAQPATASVGNTVSIQNIVYRKIYSRDTYAGFYIKACSTNNGLIRNITLEDYILSNTDFPFAIDFFWSCPDLPSGIQPGAGNLTVQDVFVRNFYGTVRHVITSSSYNPVVWLNCGASSTGQNVPTCSNIVVQNFTVWPLNGAKTNNAVGYYCANSTGQGPGGSCLQSTMGSGPTSTILYMTPGVIPPPTWGLIQDPLQEFPVYGQTTKSLPPSTHAPSSASTLSANPSSSGSPSSAPSSSASHSTAPSSSATQSSVSTSSAKTFSGSQSIAPSSKSQSNAPASSANPSSPNSQSRTPSSPNSQSRTPSSPNSQSRTPSSPNSQSRTPSSPNSQSRTPSSPNSQSRTPSSPNSQSRTPSSSGFQSNAPTSSGKTSSSSSQSKDPTSSEEPSPIRPQSSSRSSSRTPSPSISQTSSAPADDGLIPLRSSSPTYSDNPIPPSSTPSPCRSSSNSPLVISSAPSLSDPESLSVSSAISSISEPLTRIALTCLVLNLAMAVFML